MFVRQLGLSCGNNWPSTFPHDLSTEVKRQGSGVMTTFPNERAMLGAFFAKVMLDDPDILVSHNLFGFEFDVVNDAVTMPLI